jgi:hypothetical protein
MAAYLHTTHAHYDQQLSITIVCNLPNAK